MNPPERSRLTCSDGLRGRLSGEYARTKLSFLDDYVPLALAVTHRMPRRWFLDLFAGPGRNIDRDRARAEFEGSPIRALQLTAKDGTPFTDAFFVNKELPDHEALNERVSRLCAAGGSRIAENRIRILNEDTNLVLPAIMERIPRPDYVVAFADITGLKHWPMSSVRELHSHGHLSVDLYLLFPLEIALQRKLSFKQGMTDRYADDLTAFFGCEDWRPIWERRVTSADTAGLKRELTELYKTKLREQWRYVETQDTIGISDKRRLYRMIFASNHPIADKIAKWQRTSRQTGLF